MVTICFVVGLAVGLSIVSTLLFESFAKSVVISLLLFVLTFGCVGLAISGPKELMWLPVGVVFSTAMAFPVCLLTCFGVSRAIIMRRRPPKPGICRECGYDLHGLTSHRCPECGLEFDENIQDGSNVHRTDV